MRSKLLSRDSEGLFVAEKLPLHIAEIIVDHYKSTQVDLPWRTDFQRSGDPFYVWLSEIMLQQTQIKTVIPVYLRFTSEINSIQDLAESSEETVRRLVRGLGYYRRFALMHRAAKELVEHWDGGLPRTAEDLLKIAGIGAYTSAAIASIAFAQPTPAIDGNVERVVARLLDVREAVATPFYKNKFKNILLPLISQTDPGNFTQGLMEIGQTLCRPLSPDCIRCPLSKDCLANQRQSTHLAPAPKKREAPIPVVMQLWVGITHHNQFLIFQRPSTHKFLASVWGFFTSVINPKKIAEHYVHENSATSLLTKQSVKLGVIKHSITKHQIIAEVFACSEEILSRATSQEYRLVSSENLEEQLVSNLDRKAWSLLAKRRVQDRIGAVSQLRLG